MKILFDFTLELYFKCCDAKSVVVSFPVLPIEKHVFFGKVSNFFFLQISSHNYSGFCVSVYGISDILSMFIDNRVELRYS